MAPSADLSPAITIVNSSVSSLKPNPHSARVHSKRQIKKIRDSIAAFGFINPIIVDGQNVILAGHGKLEAAKLLGFDTVPTVKIDHLTPDQIRAYIIADNRIAELAGWDNATLTTEFLHLMTLTDVLDITVTGFEVAEIDQIILDQLELPDPNDDLPDEVPEPAVTKVGDIWLLGKHKIKCGNALERGCYEELLGKRKAAAVFTDPPYNVRIDGNAANIGGKSNTKHAEFAMASGEMSEPEFMSFLVQTLKLLSEFGSPESLHYIFMDWRHLYELLSAGRQAYDTLINLCVWAKNTGGMGSFYRSRHELVLIFRNGGGKNRNNIQLGKFGRDRTNVWEYPNVNTQSRQGEEGNLLKFHPTVKPVALVADALLDCTARGEIVLDPFLGSGTTLLAAERVGRACCGIEIAPRYVDSAIRRWERYTGESAIHAASGETFQQIRLARKCPMPEGHDSSEIFEVGYGKPPKHSQFQKGRSGNPQGRPKGSKNLADVLLKEARTPVRINGARGPRTVTKLEASLMQLSNQAAQGNLPAQRQFFALLLSAEEREIAAGQAPAVAEVDRGVMQSIWRRMQKFTPAPEEANVK